MRFIEFSFKEECEQNENVHTEDKEDGPWNDPGEKFFPSE